MSNRAAGGQLVWNVGELPGAHGPHVSDPSPKTPPRSKVLYITGHLQEVGERSDNAVAPRARAKTDRAKGRDLWRKPDASEREAGEENSGGGGGGWVSVMDFDSAIYS